MEKFLNLDFKLGIIAGGQLGKFLSLAAAKWNIKTHILDTNADCPASVACYKFVAGDYTNYDDVLNFGKSMDVVTLELENINVEALKALQKAGVKVYPEPEMLRIIQDKGVQKQFYQKNNIPSSSFQLFKSKEDIESAIEENKITIPFVQKSRKAGYDGRGVVVVKTKADLDNLLDVPSLVEDAVDIQKEIAVIVCRSTTGEISVFPSVEMHFNAKANLLEYQLCPAELSESIEKECQTMASKVAQSFNLEGILAVELFLTKDNELLVNEVAPRPHNSGHHTIEGNYTSQYEQHLRAILGLHLGNPEIKVPSIMVNVLGEADHKGLAKYIGVSECMALENVNIHLYGKKHTRPYRKMGHVTIVDHDLNHAKDKAQKIIHQLKVVT